MGSQKVLPIGMTLDTFMKSLKESKQLKKNLCTSQPQAIVKLHEKPIKDK